VKLGALLLAGQANVGDRGGIILVWNNSKLIATSSPSAFNLAALLRGIVFVGQSDLGAGLDQSRFMLLGVTDDARLVHLLTGKADIGYSGNLVPAWNMVSNSCSVGAFS
jgi:hypothetical protein